MDTTVHAVPIPLDQLRVSNLNARRMASKPLDDLAASILAEGLLQNLTVTENDAGEFEIVAGKRRFGALKLLQERGQLPPELASPPCRIVHDGRAVSASLAENIMREAMHPADEFVAFQRLVDIGRSVEEIAQEFGTSPTQVLRRLKLANVAADLFAKFREGEIRLDQMMALALTDDHKKQRAAWDVPHYERTADRIRERLMAKKEFRINADSAAKFVGADALEAAGVIVRRDLFSDRGEGYVTDRKHVDELALAKLEDEAERIRGEGWQWVEARLEFPYSASDEFGRIEPESGKSTLDAAAQQEMADVEAQIERMRELDEDDENDDTFDRLRARRNYLRRSGEVWTDKQKAAAGAVVTLIDGFLAVTRGLLRPGDAMPKGERGRDAAPTKPAKKSADLSRPIVDRLIAQRTAILQANVLINPDVALAILAHRLLLEALYHGEYWPDQSTTRISFRAPDALEAKASELPMMRYYTDAQDCIESIRQSLPPATKLLDWLLELPRESVVMLIAAVTSLSLDTSQMGDTIGSASPLTPLIAKLNLDFADYWEPTPETFLGHVPRAVIEATVKEACGAQALKSLENLNKAQTVEHAAQLLAGKRWLPLAMRTPPRAAAAAEAKPIKRGGKKKTAAG